MSYNKNLNRLIEYHKRNWLKEFQDRNPVGIFYCYLILFSLDIISRIIYPRYDLQFTEFEKRP
jgi:hypothetical protein